MIAKDFVVSFRFPLDDFFVRHETNVGASTASDAVAKLKKHLPSIEDVHAEPGVVMLYGSPYTTIKIDVKRSKQLHLLAFRNGKLRRVVF